MSWRFIANGFSSSLREGVPAEDLCHISGLEKVRLSRPGDAMEYDFV